MEEKWSTDTSISGPGHQIPSFKPRAADIAAYATAGGDVQPCSASLAASTKYSSCAHSQYLRRQTRGPKSNKNTFSDFLRQYLGILDALSMLSWNGEGAMERLTWYCLFLHIVWSSMSEMRLFVCCWELDGPCVSGRSGRGSQTHQFSKRFKVQTKILCENVFLCGIYLP